MTIVAANGRTLFHSENLKDHRYALELGQTMAGLLDGTLIDET